ncbi:MAG TPA: (deoxy)nucleoside triphosphate pyrophosphohydrolase [Acidobacteriota bacterium]|nr:(deoxy)nucleoside triphosphate pyrophosphohydrolase [Acidobacteriota bacterium]
MKRSEFSTEAGRESVQVAVAVLLHGSNVWVHKRRRTGHLDGLWEFPGGKIEEGESPLQALLREVREETGIELQGDACRPLRVVRHDYPQRRVELHFFLCPLRTAGAAGGGPGNSAREGEGRWVGIDDLTGLSLPRANHPVVDDLQRLFTR